MSGQKEQLRRHSLSTIDDDIWEFWSGCSQNHESGAATKTLSNQPQFSENH